MADQMADQMADLTADMMVPCWAAPWVELKVGMSADHLAGRLALQKECSLAHHWVDTTAVHSVQRSVSQTALR
jgi:hypothetical protein